MPAASCFILFALTGCDRAPSPAQPSEPALDLSEYDITRLQREMQAGALSSRQITQWSLNRIAAIDDAGPMLNAVIATNPDALAIADERDAERRAGRVRGPLHGIPVLLKDNIDTGDRQPTTAGSLALAGAPAAQDAEVTGGCARPARSSSARRTSASGRISAAHARAAAGARSAE